MKNFLKYFPLFFGLIFTCQSFSQNLVSKVITPISDAERKASEIISTVDTSSFFKTMACSGNAPYDNFANAQTLVVNGGAFAGTTCGTLEGGESTGCNTTGSTSVWFKFVATGATQYVQISHTSGGCFFGSAVYAGSTLPTTSCVDRQLSCQSSSSGPLVHLYQLTNLTVGATYYIQVVYPAGGPCGQNATFNIQVTSANPGGTITNPGYISTCATAQPGCFFNSPPTVNTVTSTCTSYPLAAAGYSANSVFTVYQQFTSSPNWSNFSWQAIITSNCGGGNVVWLNWQLFNCSCGLIGCGDISTLTGSGLACSVCYIIMSRRSTGVAARRPRTC